MIRRPPRAPRSATLFPYTTLVLSQYRRARAQGGRRARSRLAVRGVMRGQPAYVFAASRRLLPRRARPAETVQAPVARLARRRPDRHPGGTDRPLRQAARSRAKTAGHAPPAPPPRPPGKPPKQAPPP